jgi:hypothetical protein
MKTSLLNTAVAFGRSCIGSAVEIQCHFLLKPHRNGEIREPGPRIMACSAESRGRLIPAWPPPHWVVRKNLPSSILCTLMSSVCGPDSHKDRCRSLDCTSVHPAPTLCMCRFRSPVLSSPSRRSGLISASRRCTNLHGDDFSGRFSTKLLRAQAERRSMAVPRLRAIGCWNIGARVQDKAIYPAGSGRQGTW